MVWSKGPGFVQSRVEAVEKITRVPCTGVNIISSNKAGMIAFNFVNAKLPKASFTTVASAIGTDLELVDYGSATTKDDQVPLNSDESTSQSSGPLGFSNKNPNLKEIEGARERMIWSCSGLNPLVDDVLWFDDVGLPYDT
ncbi:uncharacterized protein A4U43_UnF6450 [Asparagus officinalis]|uniref:Uncharacterized protein n=1 Tax=Asparagus officinalis TaxID=4686 RepID=A0A1R3L6H2_ASPOF|nr:uncharacterized protein A4U43_UnF6450 [Asparagus officinalis]